MTLVLYTTEPVGQTPVALRLIHVIRRRIVPETTSLVKGYRSRFQVIPAIIEIIHVLNLSQGTSIYMAAAKTSTSGGYTVAVDNEAAVSIDAYAGASAVSNCDYSVCKHPQSSLVLYAKCHLVVIFWHGECRPYSLCQFDRPKRAGQLRWRYRSSL